MHHQMINRVGNIQTCCFSHTLPKMHSEHNVVPLRTVYLTVTKCLLGTDECYRDLVCRLLCL